MILEVLSCQYWQNHVSSVTAWREFILYLLQLPVNGLAFNLTPISASMVTVSTSSVCVLSSSVSDLPLYFSYEDTCPWI